VNQYKVVFSPESESELEDYYLYIANEAPQSAAKWYFNMRDEISTLDQNPSRCPYAYEDRFSEFSLRNLIIGNYRVLFRVEGIYVQILHIKHSKMKRIPIDPPPEQ
jgi:plasmid stabilization system protein ParE